MSTAPLRAQRAAPAAYLSDYPVGFFVGAFSATSYTCGRGWAAWGASRHRPRRASAALDLVR